MQMLHHKNQSCVYYTAFVNRERCWFVAGVLRSFDHLMFDRTIEKTTNRMEFFVPQLNEPYFIEIMDYFKAHGLVTELTKLPNRFADNQAVE